MLPRFQDTQGANLIATGPMVQRTAYIKRVKDLVLPLPGCRQADNVPMWMLERFSSVLERRSNRCYFRRRDWRTDVHGSCPPASLPKEAGGVETSTAEEARMMSVLIGSLVATLFLQFWLDYLRQDGREDTEEPTGIGTLNSLWYLGGSESERSPIYDGAITADDMGQVIPTV